MSNITELLDSRKNTRCFSNKPVSREIIKDLLEVINRIPVKENQIPTEITILGNGARDIKKELYINTECAPNVFNPQVLAPVVFCFTRKSKVVDDNGVTDPSVQGPYLNELHRYYTGMASMAIGLAALEHGLSIGFCQSAGLDSWTGKDKERGGCITVNGKYKKIDLSLGIGYPAVADNHASRARVTNQDASQMSIESLKERAMHETRPRLQLKKYVRLYGEDDINLPETWLNLPLKGK